MQRERTGRGWRKTIRLKHLLSSDDSPENARRVAGKVARVLLREPEYEHGDVEFGYIADEMLLLAESDDGTCADFNEILADLYDWADAERVWIG
jgi:protein involved in polysaccharide export with SLBB domain